MGKATSDKGRQRREQILDAATAILVEEGYAGFSARKIADRLGIRLSNVQYYFATPHDLLAALFEREMTRARQAFETAGSRDLETLIDMLLDGQDDAGYCRLFWELWALSARDPATADIMARFYDGYRQAIEDLIAEAAPDMPPARRHHRAILLMSMIEGLSLFRGQGRNAGVGDKALREELLALVQGALNQRV